MTVLPLGALAVAVYFTLPEGPTVHLGYSAISGAAALLVVLGIRRNRPQLRRTWTVVAGVLGVFVLTDVLRYIVPMLMHTDLPLTSVANALNLLAYPTLFLCVFRINRAVGGLRSRQNIVDTAMVCIAATALSWQFLLRPQVYDAELGSLSTLGSLVFPVMDLGVLFVVVSAIATGTKRLPSDSYVALAACCLLLGDTIYQIPSVHASYSSGDPVDAFYLMGYLLVAVAALHPSVGWPRPAPERHPGESRWLLPIVGAAAFVLPLILLASTLTHYDVDVVFLAASSIALTALVVLRVSWLFTRLHTQTAQLRHRAYHDALTGLPNRSRLHEQVSSALAAVPNPDTRVALYFCDLDGFKGVNDSLGHSIGDELLVHVSERLDAVVGGEGSIARLGGDEFAVLVTGAPDDATVGVLAERIVDALRRPVAIRDHRIQLSGSVGVALAGPSSTVEELLSEADAAMYEAKSAGKDRFRVFETTMRSRIIDRSTLLNSFSDALSQSEFYLEYQPLHCLANGALEGFEALVRWEHSALGTVGPFRFIPLAEETGFIVPLGRWILERACLEAAGWDPDDGSPHNGKPLNVSVNLSGRQLQDPNLLHDVRNALAFSGLDPRRLVLEITETVLVTNPADITAILRELKAMGIRIAVDDFGTGYSSLNYLRQFPVDILKIDKSFIDCLADPDRDDIVFIETILRLAKDLHLSATAEGIEHQVQLDILTRLGCPSAQGYLMSRPLGEKAAREYIAAEAISASALLP